MDVNSDTLRAFLAARPALKLHVLEREAGLPARTLQRVKDGRALPEKHIPALLEVLTRYGWEKTHQSREKTHGAGSRDR